MILLAQHQNKRRRRKIHRYEYIFNHSFSSLSYTGKPNKKPPADTLTQCENLVYLAGFFPFEIFFFALNEVLGITLFTWYRFSCIAFTLTIYGIKSLKWHIACLPNKYIFYSYDSILNWYLWKVSLIRPITHFPFLFFYLFLSK